jgi:hypothetical protein
MVSSTDVLDSTWGWRTAPAGGGRGHNFVWPGSSKPLLWQPPPIARRGETTSDRWHARPEDLVVSTACPQLGDTADSEAESVAGYEHAGLPTRWQRMKGLQVGRPRLVPVLPDTRATGARASHGSPAACWPTNSNPLQDACNKATRRWPTSPRESAVAAGMPTDTATSTRPKACRAAPAEGRDRPPGRRGVEDAHAELAASRAAGHTALKAELASTRLTAPPSTTG